MCFGGSSYDPNQDVHQAPYTTGQAGTQVDKTLTHGTPPGLEQTAPTTPAENLTGASTASNPGLNLKGM